MKLLSQRICLLFLDIANLILLDIVSIYTPIIKFSVTLH